jgi:hypothetical protein
MPVSYPAEPAGFVHRIDAAHSNGERFASSMPSCVKKKLTVTISPTLSCLENKIAAPPGLTFRVAACRVSPEIVSSQEICTG